MHMMARRRPPSAEELIDGHQLRDLDVDLITRGHLETTGSSACRERVRRHVLAGRRSSATSTSRSQALGDGARVARTSCRCSSSASRASGCGRWRRSRARSARTCPRCCSCACTTPAAARWPPRCSTTSCRTGRVARPLGRHAPRPSRSTRRSSRRWPSSGSTSRKEFPKPMTDEVVKAADVVITHGLRRRVPDLPGQALRGLGRSTTPPASRSRASDGSATSIYRPRAGADRDARRRANRPRPQRPTGGTT